MTIAQSFLQMVRPNQRHTQEVVDTIEKAGAVLDRLGGIRRNLEDSRKYSSVGLKSAVAESVRDLLAKEYATVTRSARRAPAYVQAQKAALCLPPIDKTDMVGELQRQEIRGMVRRMKVHERLSALSDPHLREAILAAPASVSGVPQDRYDASRTAWLQQLHGPKLAELDANANDFAAASAMAKHVRHELFKASGLTELGFEQLVRPMEIEADGMPQPTTAPVVETSLAHGPDFDKIFDAEYQRVMGHPMPSAGKKTVTRTEFDALPPPQQAALMTGTDRPTIVD